MSTNDDHRPAGTSPPSSSRAAPCDSPRASRSRSSGRSSAWCRGPSGGRRPRPARRGRTPKPGDDRLVVGKPPVAVQLGELGEQPLDVVERARPVRVARHLHALPGPERRRRSRRAARWRAPRAARSTPAARASAASSAAPRSLSAAARRALRNPAVSGWHAALLSHFSSDRARRRTRASTSRTKWSLGRMRRAVAARTRSVGPSPFTLRRRTTRGDRRDGARARRPARRIAVLAQRPCPASVISTSRTARSRTDLERRDLARRRGGSFPRRARTCRARAASRRRRRGRRICANASGKTTASTLRDLVLEHEHRHAIAALAS